MDNHRPHYPIPTWVYESVIYQIFPDRFAIGRGKTVRDKETLYTKRGGRIVDWDVPPSRKPSGEHVKEFYGGDIWGIVEKLDYLADLGVNVIYTTPIFISPSNHKYDTIDYFRIDPQFGGGAAFNLYLRRAKEKGFRILLDGVFNHLSADNAWFKSAKNGQLKHISKFTIYEDGHLCWNNYGGMPEWHLEEISVRQYVLSVVRYYLEKGIDGWRLDVGFDLGYVNNALIASQVKAISLEKYVITETWNFPAGWTVVDGIMNYHFREVVLGFVRGELENAADALEDAFMQTANIHGCWNILDSHDTERLATVVPDKNLRKLAVVLQFTFPGVPVVYYGTEIGLEGGPDPENRATMKWDEHRWDKELLEFYKRIIAIRRRETALRMGTFELLSGRRTGEPLAFLRKTPHVLDDVIVIVNPRGEQRVALSVPDGRLLAGTRFEDLFTGETFHIVSGVLRVHVPKQGFRILRVRHTPERGYDQYKRIF